MTKVCPFTEHSSMQKIDAQKSHGESTVYQEEVVPVA